MGRCAGREEPCPGTPKTEPFWGFFLQIEDWEWGKPESDITVPFFRAWSPKEGDLWHSVAKEGGCLGEVCFLQYKIRGKWRWAITWF